MSCELLGSSSELIENETFGRAILAGEAALRRQWAACAREWRDDFGVEGGRFQFTR
jgi:hypothetical protein